MAYYRRLGYEVAPAGKPYDLQCRIGATVLHVEVKGTTTTGESVLLTPNEVEFARRHAGRMELFVVHGMALERANGGVRAVGGVERILPQWDVDIGVLAPALYRYTLPSE